MASAHLVVRTVPLTDLIPTRCEVYATHNGKKFCERVYVQFDIYGHAMH